jgi:hypothetical protein
LNNNNNILLNDLKHYEVAPPSFLFENIQNKIEDENAVFGNTLKSLFNHAVVPPSDALSFGGIMSRIKETDQLNVFKPLRDYEIEAPFSFAKLMQIIRGFVATPAQQAAASGAKVISMTNFKRIVAAAAILLLGFIGYLTFQSINTGKTNSPDAPLVNTGNNTPTTPTNPTLLPPTDSSTLDQQANNPIAFIDGTKKNIFQKYSTSRNTGRKREARQSFAFASPVPATPAAKEMLINGSSFTIVDNDYLATFASFNETNLPAFLQVDKPVATTITIDDYTSITITEGMGAMMKKMYKTKKSGKPTRRARRTKEKLEKWKKADADYFNQNSTTNPLDPIDLGNFILNK